MDVQFENLNRIRILVNNKEILGTSIPSKLENDKELIDFLEELLMVLKAPKISISEKL